MPAIGKSAQTKTKGPKQSVLPSRLIIETFGNQLVDVFILVALFVLGATIVWSAVFAYLEMMSKSYGTIEDILLLFIYLELGAMIGVYFKSGIIPAQFLIYIAITVLTRMLASITVVDTTDIRIIVVVSAIVLLCFAVLILKYADEKYGDRKDKSWLS